MILVGQFQVNPEAHDYSLLISAFKRLPKEIRVPGKLARMIGFETLEIPGACLRFMGIEVDGIETAPEGLIVWDLGPRTWTVWRSGNQGRELLWQEKITWNWLEPSHGHPRRCSGEFTACGSAEWWGGPASKAQRFSMFANVYVDPLKSGFQDEIHLVEPDPAWPTQYEKMAKWLRESLGSDVALRVEHYGSTSIPGMPAKPVIDILVQIPSFEEGRKRVLPALDEATWEYWWYGEHMVFFKRKEAMGERTHHVHLAPAGHGLWQGLAFRDYLRNHSEDAARYADLKYRLAEAHQGDREGYTQAKGDFVSEINLKALNLGYGFKAAL